jgi:polyisoprenoid-binding protein YceI
VKKSTKFAIALLTLGVLAVGSFLVWFYVIRSDAPAALDSGDLDAALGTTPTDGTTGVSATDPSGTWTVTPDSVLGYRVNEVLSGLDTQAAGRTNDVSGSLTIAGTTATTAEFTVQMASITSDDSRRDGQFRNRIMSVSQFPTATFTLTSPIDFGTVPAPGQTVTATATGDLTLRGVTRSVTFTLDAKLDNGKLGILGNIPILFSDYQIPDPSNAIAKVKDNGLLEFVLLLQQT